MGNKSLDKDAQILQETTDLSRRKILVGAGVLSATAGLGISTPARAVSEAGEYIEVINQVGPIRTAYPVHIQGRGWSKLQGQGYPGSAIQQDGNPKTIELLMSKAVNHRGWTIRDLSVLHNTPGSAIYAREGIFGLISDVNIDGYANCDVAIELEEIMGFRGVRIKASNWWRYGITDYKCAGGNHSLTDCSITSQRPGALAAAKLTMNGWRIEGGELNCNVENGIGIHFEKNNINGSGGQVYIHQTRMEIFAENTRGCVFDSIDTDPWQGGIVESPQFSLRTAGVIGCDFQFCDSVTLENPGGGHRVDGAHLWRFGAKATNCVVVENNINPVLGEHFLDDSPKGSGNIVIHRGKTSYQR